MWLFTVWWFAGSMQPAVDLGPFVSEQECWEFVGDWVDKLPANVEALGSCEYKPPVMLARGGR